MADYVMVYQGIVEIINSATVLGTFGISTCVAFGIIYDDEKIAVGHIDALSLSLLDNFPQGGHGIFLQTDENQKLLEEVMKKVNPTTWVIKKSTSLMVINDEFKVDVGPPKNVNLVKLKVDFEAAMAYAAAAKEEYKRNMRGRVRPPVPPVPDVNYYWSSKDFVWKPLLSYL